MKTLKVNVVELRVQMARANIKVVDLAAAAGVHPNTINKVLRTEIADLRTVGAVTFALNDALSAGGFPEMSPFGLLMPTEEAEPEREPA